MKEKLTVIIHKFNNSILIVKRQSDLSTLLGVSISTIRRKYNDVGYYDTAIYAVYVGPETYNNNVETNYRHDVKPPIAKTYNSTERTNNTQNNVQKNVSNGLIVQSIPIFDDSIDELDDDTLAMSQYQEFYSTKTMKELEIYHNKHINKPHRLKWIDHYGKLLREKEGY